MQAGIIYFAGLPRDGEVSYSHQGLLHRPFDGLRGCERMANCHDSWSTSKRKALLCAFPGGPRCTHKCGTYICDAGGEKAAAENGTFPSTAVSTRPGSLEPAQAPTVFVLQVSISFCHCRRIGASRNYLFWDWINCVLDALGIFFSLESKRRIKATQA